MSFWIFGKQKTPKEILRENQRALRRAMRELERERTNLQRQEKNLTIEIKQMAKKGQMSAAKIMARDLVRTRSQITKFYQLKSHLQAVSLRMQTLQSQQAMSDAMKGATKAMMVMNRRMNIPAMQKILQNFEMQSEMMDMKEEMMADAMDDIFDEDQEEEETDEILNQVLDEIGINLSSELVDAPTSMGATNVKQKTAAVLSEGGGPAPGGGAGGRRPGPGGGGNGGAGGGGGGGGMGVGPSVGPSDGGVPASDEDDDLAARLEALKRN
jgi:charged multivesicular body protein 2A